MPNLTPLTGQLLVEASRELNQYSAEGSRQRMVVENMESMRVIGKALSSVKENVSSELVQRLADIVQEQSNKSRLEMRKDIGEFKQLLVLSEKNIADDTERKQVMDLIKSNLAATQSRAGGATGIVRGVAESMKSAVMGDLKAAMLGVVTRSPYIGLVFKSVFDTMRENKERKAARRMEQVTKAKERESNLRERAAEVEHVHTNADADTRAAIRASQGSNSIEATERWMEEQRLLKEKEEREEAKRERGEEIRRKWGLNIAPREAPEPSPRARPRRGGGVPAPTAGAPAGGEGGFGLPILNELQEIRSAVIGISEKMTPGKGATTTQTPVGAKAAASGLLGSSLMFLASPLMGPAKKASAAFVTVTTNLRKAFEKLATNKVTKGVDAFAKMGNSMMKGAKAFVVMGAGLVGLGLGLRLFVGLQWNALAKSALVLGALTAAVVAVGKVDGSVKKGALAIGLMGLALLPAALNFKKFADIDISKGMVVLGTMTAITIGISRLANPAMALGIAALGAIGLALMPMASSFNSLTSVDWGAVTKAGVAIVAFSAGVIGLGLLMDSVVGAGVFASGLLALVGLAGTLQLLGMAMQTCADSISTFSTAFNTIGDSLDRLGSLDGVALLAAAAGITAVGAAIAAFGTGSMVGSIMDSIGKFFGSDIITNFERLANIAPNLMTAANAINMIRGEQPINERERALGASLGAGDLTAGTYQPVAQESLSDKSQKQQAAQDEYRYGEGAKGSPVLIAPTQQTINNSSSSTTMVAPLSRNLENTFQRISDRQFVGV